MFVEQRLLRIETSRYRGLDTALAEERRQPLLDRHMEKLVE